MNNFYLTVAKDGSFYLSPFLPDKKYFAQETKIFELPENTPIRYIYNLIGRQIAVQDYQDQKLDYL